MSAETVFTSLCQPMALSLQPSAGPVETLITSLCQPFTTKVTAPTLPSTQIGGGGAQGMVTLINTGLEGPAGPAGPTISEEESVYAKRVDFVGDATIYRGEAAVGTQESQPLWRIRRISIAGDGDVTEEWAGGTALFDKVWDNRATLGYS